MARKPHGPVKLSNLKTWLFPPVPDGQVTRSFHLDQSRIVGNHKNDTMLLARGIYSCVRKLPVPDSLAMWPVLPTNGEKCLGRKIRAGFGVFRGVWGPS